MVEATRFSYFSYKSERSDRNFSFRTLEALLSSTRHLERKPRHFVMALDSGALIATRCDKQTLGIWNSTNSQVL